MSADRVVRSDDLYVFIDLNQAIEFRFGNQPFTGHWMNGMPGDGAIYRDEEGKVIGGYFPFPFRDVKIDGTEVNHGSERNASEAIGTGD